MHILNCVLGPAEGGRWQVVCDYSRLFLRRGHRVSLLVNSRTRPDLSAVPAGAAVEHLANHGHYDLLAAWRQRRRFLPSPPDMALAHCSRSVALLRRALPPGVPLVAVSHSPKVQRLLPADVCLALNADIGARFGAASGGKPYFVVPNMISVSTTTLPPWRPHEPVRFAALGRFDPVKGFDVFVDALGLLQQRGYPFEAWLGGDGEERARLEARAAARGLTGRLRFPGWVKDVERFLAGIDILCVPARSDAFGLTPLQAARAGVPMVLAANPGHQGMFAAEEQVLFAAVDAAADTAEQLARLGDQPDLAARLRESAFATLVRRYSVQAGADELIDLIENKIFNIIA